jgi:hypothetical protein
LHDAQNRRDISQSTKELVLSEMLSGGMIEKIGGGRGT